MPKQKKTFKKNINNTATNFVKCADLHCGHIIKTSELYKLAMNSLGKSKSKKAKYNTKFKQRMQCIDKHCSESKNKFNSVINTVKTKKQKINTKNHNTQHAGANQLTDQNIINQIITAVNRTPELITEINNALQNYNLQKISTNKKVNALQQKYSAEQNDKQLYDLIYVGQKLTQYDSAKQSIPSLIWDHGINNPNSITAGKLGTHIYIYKDSNSGLFKLLGVIIRNDKMSIVNRISEGLTFLGL